MTVFRVAKFILVGPPMKKKNVLMQLYLKGIGSTISGFFGQNFHGMLAPINGDAPLRFCHTLAIA